MKFLILLILVACSSPKAEEQKSQTRSQQGEPETIVIPAKKPACLCNKMLMPVCADGKTYSNSCLAKCEGHQKWTEGECSK